MAEFWSAEPAESAEPPLSKVLAKFGIAATRMLVMTQMTGIGDDSATKTIEPAPNGMTAPATSEAIDAPSDASPAFNICPKIETMK